MDDSIFYAIAVKLEPRIANLPAPIKAGRVLDIIGLLAATPVALLGLLWLAARTDIALLQANWFPFLVIFILILIFDHYSFTISLELSKGVLSTAGSSLVKLVYWSAALILGPTGLWLVVIVNIVTGAYGLLREGSRVVRWNGWLNLATSSAALSLSGLLGLGVYEALGGTYPLPDLSWPVIWSAFVGTAVNFIAPLIIMSPLLWFMASLMEKAIPEQTNSGIRMILFFITTNSLTDIVYPFTILAAGLYTLHGISVYLFFMSGAFLASVLAHRLSQAAQQSQQRTNELDALEKLGRAIINSPPDATLLPELLQEYMPSMMVRTLAVIWFLPNKILFQSSTAGDGLPQFEMAKKMVQELEAPFGRLHKILATTTTNPFAYKHEGVVVPIRTEGGNLVGGIYVLQRQDIGNVEDFVPALQSLAAQLASAVHREQVYLETLQRQKMAQELAFAGRIQQSFLPHQIPQHPNWDFAATLIPARQTSGDFYDFVPLSNGRLGLIVADVADKGTGAALYMALSRTLIRTYAMQLPDEPGKALQLANERILSDTESDQFVTVFYGVLELDNGRFTYANAGHNPTYHLGSQVQTLSKTGIPLGMFEGMAWQQETIQIGVGESLILYSDGVPEAQNSQQEEFGEARMLATAQQALTASATARQTAIAEAVSEFVGDAPQFDDITLMVTMRIK